MKAMLAILAAVTITLLFVQVASAYTGDISVGGVWVCRLTQGAGGLTLAQRVDQIERNMYAVLNNLTYRAVGQVPVSVRGSAIVVEDVVLLVVTPADAEGTGAKPSEAAQQWAQRLAIGLSQALPLVNPSGM